MDAMEKKDESPVCVVGIGASAGGLEAIGELLEKLPDNTGMAFVIIQHLSPDYRSMLSEILCKYTMMPVIQATNGLKLQKNTIYLIPPKFNMETRKGCLVLHEFIQAHVINHPIDIFFRSLAEEYETHAVAVVLSGTGSDGTNGIRTIKEQGGVIIVQRPETAKFDGMPRSALSTGFVDLSLGPDAIADELAKIGKSMAGEVEGMSDEELLNKIYSILKKASNINYTYYKQNTILRRIERRMMVNHIDSLYGYVDFLRKSNDEAITLSKDVLIGVTAFFRDPECFEALKERVIIPLITNTNEHSIRVWVAGCSTGEEAYSIGILFLEAMEETGLKRQVKIFATDLDRDAVTTAGKGFYGDNIIEDISTKRLGKYFTKKGNGYLVNQELRKLIVFAPQNVFQDPPFGKLNLISCRNMLIYFQNVLQKDLFAIFHLALNDGGYLFLGKSESVSDTGDVFNTLCPNEKIFLHNSAGRAPEGVKLRYHLPLLNDETEPISQSSTEIQKNEEDQINLKLLDDFMAPCLLVDENNHVQRIFGDCSNYVRIPKGKTENNLFSMLTQSLRLPVSTALKSVRTNNRPVCYDSLSVVGEKNTTIISLNLLSVAADVDNANHYVAVIMSEKGTLKSPIKGKIYKVDEAAAQRISDLEQDLAKSQTRLKSAVNELETVNEELQATNEELLTSNEELQSSNEELQSVNEELYTVNAEYQEKLNEVTSLNDDISNFLSSTLVGIIFLDDKFQIRRFTNYISKEFNIIEQDIGRSLQIITYNFININLVELCEKVKTSMSAIETDVIAASGKTYFMRIAPFRTEENKILGLVLTFVDTTLQGTSSKKYGDMETALKEAKEDNLEKENFLSRMSHDMRTPLNGIIGTTQLMKNNDGLSDEQNSQIDTIQENGQYLLSIISDILETSRIKAGKLAVSPMATDEKHFLEGVLPMIQSDADRKGITLTGSIKGAQSRKILMDSNHTLQILMNLLSNAIKFTPEGGKIEANFTVNDLPNGKVEHEYVISDTGCGMSSDFQKKIYLPFTQDKTSLNSANSGTGLGLYICKCFVDAMGGSIDCHSQENVGTTFVIKLVFPLAEKEAPESKVVPLTEKEEKAYLSGKRILIVEDQKINYLIAQKMLERLDIVSEVATNGLEAVNKFSSASLGYYSAILMDVRMPIMDGYKATFAIRKLKRGDAKAVPIIAMTADGFADDKVSCLNSGMNDLILKPVDMGTLYRVLYHWISLTEEEVQPNQDKN
jgi:two-component system CheB/CheR fusion protein